MKDFHHSRDNLKKTKKNNQRKRAQSDLDKEVEAYIMSSDEDYPLYKLANTLKSLKLTPQRAKQLVKGAIRENIKDYDPLADGYSLYLTNGLEETLSKFSMADFVNRNWQYTPLILTNADYKTLQECEKFPLYMDRYDYSLPLHKFGNNISFQNELTFKKRKIKNSNDISFYTTKEENMLFAKVTNLKFEPINHALIREASRDLVQEEREKLKYNPRLYNRTFSISLYALLDGDPKKSHPFIRYDCASMTHSNVFMAGDKREGVYGLESDNPHFHFQNEDDLLLCTRKYRDNSRRLRWKTGKCNSIDLKHLVKYLVGLDNTPYDELEKLDQQNQNYGMPFLNIKIKGKKIDTINIDKLLNSYLCSSQEEKDYINSLREDFKLYCLVKPSGTGEKSFKKLISSLQFLQFVHDERFNSQNCDRLELLSNLEVECATNVVNAITNCSSKILERDYKPKFVIDNEFLSPCEKE